MSYLDFVDSVEINPTELCNLRCDFCPRAHGYPNLNYHMSKETIDCLADSLVEFYDHKLRSQNNPLAVVVTGRGEPALCKNYHYLLETLLTLQKSNIVQVKVNTNAYKFDRFLSLYKQCRQVYVNLYDNFSYDEYVVFREKYKDYNNILVHFRRGDVSEINGKKINTNYTNRAGGVETDITNINVIDSRCDLPFRQLYVDWNGDYNLCCHDWTTKLVLGNIHQTGLVDYVLYNPTLARFRTNLSKGIRCEKPCEGCNYQPKSHFSKIKVIGMFRQFENQLKNQNTWPH